MEGAHFSSPGSSWPWKTLCFSALPIPSTHTGTSMSSPVPLPLWVTATWPPPSDSPSKMQLSQSQLGQETPSPLVVAPQSFSAHISWSLGGGGAQNLALGQQGNNSSSVMTLSALSLFQPSLYKDHGWVMAVRDERPVWQPLSWSCRDVSNNSSLKCGTNNKEWNTAIGSNVNGPREYSTFSGRSQRKTKHYMIYVESKKWHECIFKTETCSKINLWLTKGRGWVGGQIRETGLTDTDCYT